MKKSNRSRKDLTRLSAEKALGRPLKIEELDTYDTGYLDGFKASVTDGEPNVDDFSTWYSRLLFSSVAYPASGHPLGTCLLRDVVRDQKVKAALKEAFNRIIMEEEEDVVHSQP